MFPIAADKVAKMDKSEVTYLINGQQTFKGYLIEHPRAILWAATIFVILFDWLLWQTPIFQRVVLGAGPLNVEVPFIWRLIHWILLFGTPIICFYATIRSVYMRAKVKKAACYADNMQLLQIRLDELVAEENLQNQKQATCYTNAVKEIEAILQKCDCNNVSSLKWQLSNYLRTQTI